MYDKIIEKERRMKKKAKKEKKNEKRLIGRKKFVIVGIAVVLAVALVSVVLGLNLRRSRELNDDYFVSDGTKLVLTIDNGLASFVENELEPGVVHIVYYYSGDKIDDAKIFFVYDDEEEASVAYDGIGDSYEGFATSKELNGKYVVFQAIEESYKNLSTERLKNDIKSIEAVNDTL